MGSGDRRELLDQEIDRKGPRLVVGLGTDLGGYSIMIGGTSGAHLTSFSLVDVLSHGRACAIMNPYYTVFFAPAIERPLKLVGNIFKAAGYTDADIEGLTGRELGMAVAEAMIAFNVSGSLRRVANHHVKKKTDTTMIEACSKPPTPTLSKSPKATRAPNSTRPTFKKPAV